MPIELKERHQPRTRRPRRGKGTKYKIRCVHCGRGDKVPFKPRTRNVLCSFCHRQKKEVTPHSS